tara:strand:+ start:1874 stop:2020 length:147 start_codon:yes stop_codon:yes gene_type:complete
MKKIIYQKKNKKQQIEKNGLSFSSFGQKKSVSFGQVRLKYSYKELVVF